MDADTTPSDPLVEAVSAGRLEDLEHLLMTNSSQIPPVEDTIQKLIIKAAWKPRHR